MLRALKSGLAAALPGSALHRLRRLTARFGPNEAELALVPLLAPRGAVFVDIGANKGEYVEAALKAGARVIAVEPHPGMAAYLRDVFKERIELLEFALSDQAGTFPLYVPAARGTAITTRSSLNADANPDFAQGREVAVSVRRLDDLDLPPLALVKIDVEGHEGAALRGARARLAADRPVLIVEIEERHHQGGSAPVVAGLEGLGYRSFYLKDGRLHRLAGPIAALQASGSGKGFDTGRDAAYVNNFIFIHEADRATPQRLGEGGYALPA